MSERRACRLVNQPRGTQRYHLTQREDEDALTQAITDLATQYGRYGYPRSPSVVSSLYRSRQLPRTVEICPRGVRNLATAKAANDLHSCQSVKQSCPDAPVTDSLVKQKTARV